MKRTHARSRHALRAVAAAAVTLVAAQAHAAGAVGFRDWDGVSGNNAPSLGLGASISATQSLAKSSYADNPALMYSAWAHAGGSPWYSFQLTASSNVTIDLTPVVSSVAFNPGLTVWASGSSAFDGGSEGIETGFNGWGDPHSFNAVGRLGDHGTAWMTGAHGNMQQTLAYAVTGPSHADTGTTGWGESIEAGVHDLRTDNSFASGVKGDAAGNTIGLRFKNLQAGWYTVFVGGTNHALASADYTLKVSAVPEPQTWALMAGGLLAVGALTRRRTAARSLGYLRADALRFRPWGGPAGS